jgi:hypothetical protein
MAPRRHMPFARQVVYMLPFGPISIPARTVVKCIIVPTYDCMPINVLVPMQSETVAVVVTKEPFESGKPYKVQLYNLTDASITCVGVVQCLRTVNKRKSNMNHKTIVTFNNARIEVTPEMPQEFHVGASRIRVELVPDEPPPVAASADEPDEDLDFPEIHPEDYLTRG